MAFARAGITHVGSVVCAGTTEIPAVERLLFACAITTCGSRRRFQQSQNRIPGYFEKLACPLIILLLIVQIWLLSAALESFLAGHFATALPAVIFSGLLFLACFGLNLFVDRVDRDSHH
jgi:hypothetical protein